MERIAARWRMVGLGLAVLLLAPAWGAGLVTNGGLLAYQQREWPEAARWWTVAASGAGPGGEWARLAARATDRAGDGAGAGRLAARAVGASPGAPLPLWQQGLIQHAQGQPTAALESWRQAEAENQRWDDRAGRHGQTPRREHVVHRLLQGHH